MIIAQSVLLVMAVAVIVYVSDQDQWTPLPLTGLVALLVLGSDLLVLDAKRFRIGGSFTGLVLAMALLGPSPAVAIGLGCALVDALHARTRGISLLANAATYTFFPLLGGIVLGQVEHTAFSQEGGFAFSVFIVFCIANVLNFTMVAGHIVLMRGGSLREMFGRVFLPVVPWELATGSMTAMAVYGFEKYGTGVVGLFVLALGVCQLLLRSLLRGHEHGEEVLRRKDQLDVRH